MKTMIRISILILAVAFLAGCYIVTDTGVGSVGIEIPDASSTGDPAPETLARIYLINGRSLVDISDGGEADGVAFKLHEIEGAENEVSVGPVASGPGYRVVIALGDTNETTDVFIPGRYAWTEDEFAVVAGQAVPIELTAVSTPFGHAGDLLGMNLVDIEFIGSNLYTASAGDDGSALYELDLALAITDTEALPADEEAISISTGAYIQGTTTHVSNVPWVNTSRGIIPYYLGALVTGWSDDTVDPLPPILDSGAFIAGAGDDLFGWFQTDGGLGGVYDEKVSAADKQWVEGIDLSTFISGQPVYDLAVDFDGSTVTGYFASKLGAFRLPQVVLTDTTGAYDSVQEIIDAGVYFDVVINAEEAVITELALVPTTSDLYLGTNRGVVKVDTNDVGLDTIPNTGLVADSIGRTVREMSIGMNYHAILTDNLLIVSSDSGSTYTVIPIYAGIVTAPTGMFLNDATGVLYIAGEAGMAWVDIDDI